MEREYTAKQYAAGPNGMKIIRQNQMTCFHAGESSKRNKKNSIPTVISPAATTPIKRICFSSGVGPFLTIIANEKKIVRETTAAVR